MTVYGLQTKADPDNTAVKATSVDIRLDVWGTIGRVIFSGKYTNTGTHQHDVIFCWPMAINEQSHVPGILGVWKTDQTIEVRMETQPSPAELSANSDPVWEVAPSSGQWRCPLGVLAAGEHVEITFDYSCELAATAASAQWCLPDLLHPGCSAHITFNAEMIALPGMTVKPNCSKIKTEYIKKRSVCKINLDDVLTSDDDLWLNVELGSATDPMSVLAIPPTSDSTWTDSALLLSACPPTLDGGAPQGQGNEYIFLVDRSGSMRGDQIDHAKDTVLLFLKSLPPGCAFNIIGFGSSFEKLFMNGSQVYCDKTLELAMDHLTKIDANMGGTNLLSPLKFVFSKPPLKGRDRHLFVLTDGCVSSSAACIEEVKSHATDTKVHAFGIGYSVDRVLVTGLAKAGGGNSDFVNALDRSMESKIMATLGTTLRPCVTISDVTLNAPGLALGQPITEHISQPLFLGDRRNLYYKLEGNVTSACKGTVTLTYSSGEEQVYRLGGAGGKVKGKVTGSSLQVTGPASSSLHRLHAAARVRTLLSTAAPDDLKESEELCERFGLAGAKRQVVCRCQTSGRVIGVVRDPPAPSTPAPTFQPPPPPQPTSTTGGTGAGKRRGVGRGAGKLLVKGTDNAINAALRKPVLKRLAHRGGVRRISPFVYDECREHLKTFLTKLVKDASLYAEQCRRKMVTESDVDAALKRNGINLYGIEDTFPYRFEGGDTSRRGRQRRQVGHVVMRTTPPGQPDATGSVVASVLQVAPPKQAQTSSSPPQLSKQRTRSISELSGSLPTRLSSTRQSGSRTSGTGKPSTSTSFQASSRLGKRASTASQASGTTETTGTPTKKAKATAKPAAKPRAKPGRKSTKTATSFRKPAVSKTRSQRSSVAGPSTASPDFPAMVGVITLQTFDGSWDLSKALAQLLNQPLDHLQNHCPKVKNLKSWATALAVTWLYKHFLSARMEWEMIEYKGLGWLRDTEGATGAESLRQAASKLV